MGAILGLVNDDFHTNQFDRSGTLWRWVRRRCALSSNTIMRSYVGDTFRVNRSLTLTFGLRWEDTAALRGTRIAVDIHRSADAIPLRSAIVFQSQGCHRTQCQRYPKLGPEWPGEWQTNVVGNFQSELRHALRIGLSPDRREAGGSGRFSERVERSGQEQHGYDRFGSDLITQYDQNGSLGVAE